MGLLMAGLLLVAAAGLGIAGQYRIEQRYPPAGKFIEVGGQRLHYIDEGSGPALLLVHGASSNLQDFAASIVPELSPRFRVIAFDRPGFGYSPRYPGEWRDPEALAGLFLDAAEQLGAAQPVVLGHSWGGSVAMSAMVHHRERIRGGILLSGVAGHWVGSTGWMYDVAQLPLLGPMFAHTLVYPAGSLLLPDMVKGILAPNPVPENYIERMAAPLALRPKNFLHNVEDVTRLSEYMQVLSRDYAAISKPLLVIHGDADTVVPYWNHGQRLEPVLQNLEIKLLEGAGHAPHHTHTDEVSAYISDFMQRLNKA